MSAQQEVKALVISRDYVWASLTPRFLNCAHPDLSFTIDSRAAAEVGTQDDVLEILDGVFAVVTLPLTLPYGMSLYLAELTHRFWASYTLILTSGTQAPREVLVPLFDAFIHPFCRQDDWRVALECGPRRFASQMDINAAIERVIYHAECFSGHHGRIRTQNEY